MGNGNILHMYFETSKIQYYHPDLIEVQNAPLTYSLCFMLRIANFMLHYVNITITLTTKKCTGVNRQMAASFLLIYFSSF